ncbi:hypothetical protein [Streptomyces sp. XD-27]|uniref:hypothetical protein n=1 Tax=Streptomyces sp. XD-27 TaxID=3062779 RepID=UPI0026F438B7|nr:hypothetical protein [Streptomyces sp. XD-27]WKX73588.1 hypothetical protein Q3Y56_30150 [Streptomyces sp. XD-27]
MTWIALLSTVVGAMVGLGSALLSDGLRWKRERNDRRLSVQREIYVAYLGALHLASQSLRAVSLGDHSEDVPRNLAARAAMRDAGLVETREHLVLTAPEAVVQAADAAFQSLRVLRDRIAQGQGMGSPEYEADLSSYNLHLQVLRNAVRDDLQVGSLRSEIAL